MWARKIASTSSNAAVHSPPNVDEPRDIDEFLDKLLVNFEAAASKNLQTLADCKYNPKDSLHVLGTRFNRIVVALALLQHLPLMIRNSVEE